MSGYSLDSGAAFDAARGTGWQTSAGVPLSLVGNGRARGLLSDLRLDTFVHMQLKAGSAGVSTVGRYEAVAANGTYTLTVGVGDASYVDSRNVIRAEGSTVVDFVPTNTNRTMTASASVTVRDGRLTIDAVGGTNTKLGYLDLVAASAPTSSAPTSSAPTSSAPTSTAPTSSAPTSTAPTSAAPTSAWPSTWTPAASGPGPDFESSATLVAGKIYRFGGFKNADFQVDRTYSSYDVGADRWTMLGTLPTGMAESHVAVANDGLNIYLAGGFSGDLHAAVSPSQWISDRVMRYNTATGEWTQIASLPQPRGAGALEIVGRSLHYIGGNPADRVTNVGDHFVFDLDSGSWTTAAAMPDPKDHFSSVVLNGLIYTLGGEHGHDQQHSQQASVHVYDPALNTWRRLADLPRAKSHLEAGTFVSNDKIIMAGGQIDNFRPTSVVYSYDPATNQWSTLAPLPAARQGAIVQRVGNQVVVALGAIETNQPQSRTWVGQI